MNGTGKFAAAAATALLALSLAGCAGNASSSASASAPASSSAAASVSAAVSSGSPESSSASSPTSADALAPGEYTATFDTDSSMFHVNEADDGTGLLTVADDGTMTIHVSLVSKKIVNVYPGTADEAAADEANVIQPTTDTVTYKDGTTEEVFGFDIPVPALDEQFDVAILGEKGTWYDHKVSVSDPQAQ